MSKRVKKNLEPYKKIIVVHCIFKLRGHLRRNVIFLNIFCMQLYSRQLAAAVMQIQTHFRSIVRSEYGYNFRALPLFSFFHGEATAALGLPGEGISEFAQMRSKVDCSSFVRSVSVCLPLPRTRLRRVLQSSAAVAGPPPPNHILCKRDKRMGGRISRMTSALHPEKWDR